MCVCFFFKQANTFCKSDAYKLIQHAPVFPLSARSPGAWPFDLLFGASVCAQHLRMSATTPSAFGQKLPAVGVRVCALLRRTSAPNTRMPNGAFNLRYTSDAIQFAHATCPFSPTQTHIHTHAFGVGFCPRNLVWQLQSILASKFPYTHCWSIERGARFSV